jgi:hypothetical protein
MRITPANPNCAIGITFVGTTEVLSISIFIPTPDEGFSFAIENLFGHHPDTHYVNQTGIFMMSW